MHNRDSRILWVQTTHKRFGRPQHHFSYPLFYLWLNLQRKPGIRTPFFAWNSFAALSIYESDYLQETQGNILQKLDQLRQKWGVGPSRSVYLLSVPRWLGKKTFNPISFYFELGDDSQILSVIVEVTNTYQDKHVYYIPGSSTAKYLDSMQAKTFHVSPFLSDSGKYHFRIRNSCDDLEIHIRLLQGNTTVFYANLLQKGSVEMNNTSIISTFFRYPLGIIGIFPRILFQAGILHYFKSIPASRRSIPKNENTVRRKPPTFFEGICIKIVFRVFSSFTNGSLILRLPNGSVQRFGTQIDPVAELQINDYSFFTALVLDGEIGFGESYVLGVWETPNLTDLIGYFIYNKNVKTRRFSGNIFRKFARNIAHYLRKNNIRNSRKNIQAHYDLGNDFYRLFLDHNMNYSSAYFSKSHTDLESAQMAKIDRLVDKLRIRPEHHVLEIGSGWGAAAIRIAKRTGCRVTTLTLSNAQFEAVNNLIRANRLEEKVRVLLEDYRLHKGLYNRILSIEMIEAVGHDFLPTYFQRIDAFLAPDGIAAIQAITIPDQRYDYYRSRVDWIQKHIFPGGHLPSLSAIQNVLLNHTNLMIESVENIGPHYARTLAQWRRRFLDNGAAVKSLGFDENFIRKWCYYLAYCEAGFKNRYINTLQFVLTRPLNQELIQEDINAFRS